MNFKPLHNAIVVEPLAECERTSQSSVIIMPSSALRSGRWDEQGGTLGNYTDKGKVVAVGAGYKYGRRFIPDYQGATTGKWEDVMHSPPLPLEVKPGDVVIYSHKGGEDHILEDGKFRIISERHIDAVLETDF